MSDLRGIRELKETSDVNEANYLLKSGWRLLGVGAGYRFIYLLGKEH